MVRKKLVSLVMVAAMVVGSLAVSALPTKAADYGNYVYHDFESGLSGWGPRGIEAEEVAIATDDSYSGTQSIKITNRSNTWHGATCDMTSELTKGETYNFSIRLKYKGDSYPSTQKFSLQLQYNDGTNDQYRTIKTASVNKGQWTLLSGEYTIPTDSNNVFIYVETEYKSQPTSSDFLDFYLDDFIANPAVLPEIQHDIPSLQDVYASYFNIGGAATASEIAPRPAKDLVLKHYNNLTFGNELKPDAVLDHAATLAYLEETGNNTTPQISLRSARALLEFAKANNLPVRGHTLVWHSQTPDWFFRENYGTSNTDPWASKAVMLQRLENYIKDLMALIELEYPTVEFYAWDVVNEAVDPNTSTGMRTPGSNNTNPGSSLWMQTVGKEFIEKAFEYARKYAPEGCLLFYNDYNEYESVKMNHIYNILVDLKAKGLVDGMGMQSHWVMEYPSISMFETAVRKYNTLGIEIQLTELDIKQPDNSTSAQEALANRYKLLMNKVVSLKNEGMNITNVIFWGVTDKTSWLGGYPLLFDGDYQAKPAYYAIIEGMEVVTPTVTPTATPTATPTTTPTATPTATPTTTPTATPTVTPTTTPTVTPTITPIPSGDELPVVKVTSKNSGNSIMQQYEVTASSGTIDLSKLRIEYVNSAFSGGAHNVYCDQAALILNVSPYYKSINSAVQGSVSNNKLVITVNEQNFITNGVGRFTMDLRIARTDWSTMPTLGEGTLQVYYNGVLVQ